MMDVRVESLTEKVELLEKTVELFRKEFALKMKIVHQLLSTKHEKLVIQKKSLEQETSMYKFLLSSWTDDLLHVHPHSHPHSLHHHPQPHNLHSGHHGHNLHQLLLHHHMNHSMVHTEHGNSLSDSVQIIEEIMPGESIAYRPNEKNKALPSPSLNSNHSNPEKSISASIQYSNPTTTPSSRKLNGQRGRIASGDGGDVPYTKACVNIGSGDSNYFEPEEIEMHEVGISSNHNENEESLISISDDENGYEENENSCSSIVDIKFEGTHFDDVEITIPSEDDPFPLAVSTIPVGHTCKICGCFQTTSKALKSHMIQVHRGGTGGFICHYCGKNFSQLGCLNQHKRIHLEGKSLQCSFCPDVDLTSLEILLAHMKCMHGIEKQVCELCGKDFAGPTYLKRHMCIFHNEEMKRSTKRNKKCSLCPKSYQTRADLLVHIRSHTGEKPYACTGCQKPFADMRNLKRHQDRFPDCKIANQINQEGVEGRLPNQHNFTIAYSE